MNLDDLHQHLRSLGERRRLEPGSVLIRRGEYPDALHLVDRGRLRVTLLEGGREREVAAIGALELAGEMSFVTGDPASATVVADGEVEVTTIRRAAVEAAGGLDPSFAAHLYGHIAALVAERLQERIALGEEAGDGPPAARLAGWTQLLARLQAIRFPEVARAAIARYEEVGDRKAFLWRWCWRGLEETTLPLVPEDADEELRTTKLLAVILNVVLDDLADRPGDGVRLELALAAIHGAGVPPLVPDGTRPLFEFVVDLWQTISLRVRALAGYRRFASLYAFDYEQVFNTMRYSAIAHGEPALRNLAENAAYAPHNMNMMVFATIDVMTGPVRPADFAAIREAAWHAQSMGQLGNMLTTWRREIPERDFSSRAVIHALDAGVVGEASLATADPEALIAAIEASDVEERLLREWRHSRRRLNELIGRVESMDLARYLRGVDTLLAMNQAARGLI